MQIFVGDKVITKKKHPCGSDRWTLTRVGMDIKMKCDGCAREIMLPRSKAEKAIKEVIGSGGQA